MPFAVSYTTGRIVRSTGSTEPVAQLHAEQFEVEDDAVDRAFELIDDERFHCVLVHSDDELLFTEADLFRIRRQRE